MRDYEEILAEIYQGLQDSGQDRASLTEDTELVGDLGLDSVQVMEMLLEVEDRFNISIPVNILADVVTVRDLARQIQRLTGD